MGGVKEKLSWGGNFCRGILCCFNFLFLLGGVILLSLGIWVLVEPNSKHLASLLTDDLHRTAAYILLVAGLVVLVVSVFGFCGAKQENKCCLGMYVLFLVIIFIIEIVAGGVALYFYVKTDVETDLSKTLKDDYGNIDAVTGSWDFIQTSFDCCAVKGNASTAIVTYEDSSWYKNQTTAGAMKVPESCCNDKEKIAECQMGDIQYIYDKGCTDSVIAVVAEYGTVLGVIGIIVAVIQLMGLACALCLCKRL